MKALTLQDMERKLEDYTTGEISLRTNDNFVLQHKLKASNIGKRIVYTDVTGSTMDDARKFGIIGDHEQYPHGTVIMAERQTKARGARDHKWDASNTGNIYVSIILHMPQFFKSFEGRFEIEVAACMAVWSVARNMGVKVMPKWPNDLWVRGHKLAGFLVEDSRFDIPGSNLCLVILGMGINVNADIRQNAELHSIATSLLCERNGMSVCREDFFAEVCFALEETMMSRSDNLSKFCSYNLFQKGCNISVTCPSENRVIDGEFVEICDNWEVKFVEMRTKAALQGRSDYYVIRPKVQRKIMVVFTGLSRTKSASVVASKLMSIIDTSKHVVCIVPESAISQSEEWMKTCDLLVLAEEVHDWKHLSIKLTRYLKNGGSLMTLSVASSFAAKLFEIPVKEEVLDSLFDNADFSVISVEYDGDHQKESGDVIGSPCSHVMFPSSLIYFKFGKDCAVKCLSSGMEKISFENEMDDSGDGPSASQSQNKCGMALKYFQWEEENEHSIAIITRPTTHGGYIALFGFDLGVILPSTFPLSEDRTDGNNQAKTDTEKIVEEFHRDRFQRDKLICQVLNILGVE